MKIAKPELKQIIKEVLEAGLPELPPLAKQVFDVYQQGSAQTFKELITGVLEDAHDQVAVYKELMNVGGFPPGTFDNLGFMDEIRSGEIKLQSPIYVRAAAALRTIMTSEALDYLRETTKTSHTLPPRGKYVGDSQQLDALARQPSPGKVEENFQAQLKQMIEEELEKF